MHSGDRLDEGQSLVSPNGAFHLDLGTDGNLVLYSSSSEVRWTDSVNNLYGPNYLVLQSDGNLVDYLWTGLPLWSSSTSGRTPDRLFLQDDGNLLLMQNDVPFWTTYGGLAQGIVSAAASQVGTPETPMDSGCNPFTAFFGRGSSSGCSPGTASESWCADFANWVWLRAGSDVAGITAWSFTFVTYGQARGSFKQGAVNDPRPGDAVVWGSLADYYGTHVGIVVGVTDSKIDVISGNADSHVWASGYFDPGSSTVSGYSIVGYISPSSGGARFRVPHHEVPRSLAMINTQDGGP